MLTYDQAVYFLEGVLRMPPNWRLLLQNDPLQFLTFYMKRHAVRVPFQSLEMGAVEPSCRWFPSEDDIATTGLGGKGGCCIILNYFSMMVFRAIGLDSFAVRGDHYQAPVAGTHCLVMVKLYGPKHFGIYMIEVGGYPILEPIPMDSDKLPYRTLQAVGFPYEFREFAPAWIGKFHMGGGVMGGKYTDKDEVLRTSWDLKPRGLWEFDYPMLETFTNPPVSLMLRSPLMYRYFSNTEFRKLFPDLPENANAKERNFVTTTKSMPKFGKVLAITGKSKLVDPKLPSSVASQKTGPLNGPSNGKTGPGLVSNGITKPTAATTGTKPTPIIANPDSEEDEYEVVTEEDTTSDDDDDQDPQNFIYVYKRRIVVGDKDSRKIIKDYNSYEEMGKDLKKYFPRIPEAAVDKAMEMYSQHKVVPIPYDLIL